MINLDEIRTQLFPAPCYLSGGSIDIDDMRQIAINLLFEVERLQAAIAALEYAEDIDLHGTGEAFWYCPRCGHDKPGHELGCQYEVLTKEAKP